MRTRFSDPARFAHDQLDAALEHARDDTARYHIRTALQAVEAIEAGEAGEAVEAEE